MGDMTQDLPKSLLPYKGRPILERLLGQLARTSIEKVVLVVGYQKARILEFVRGLPFVTVVENDRFAEDTNIHSMRLALRQVSGSVVIFEADTIMEDAMVNYVTGTDFEYQSAWFTKGPFEAGMYGGIVKSDAEGKIVDVRVVPQWDAQLGGYSKMTGVMRIGHQELPTFRQHLEAYAERSIAQYFFAPWAEQIELFPAV